MKAPTSWRALSLCVACGGAACGSAACGGAASPAAPAAKQGAEPSAARAPARPGVLLESLGVETDTRGYLSLLLSIPDGRWLSTNSHVVEPHGGEGGGLILIGPPDGVLEARARCLDERGVVVLAGTSLDLLDARFAGRRGADGRLRHASRIKLALDRPCEIGVRVEGRLEPATTTETFYCWQRPGKEAARPGRCTQFSAKPSPDLLTAVITRVERTQRIDLLGMGEPATMRAGLQIEAQLTLGAQVEEPMETRAVVRCEGKADRKPQTWSGMGRFVDLSGWYEPGDVLPSKAAIELQGPVEDGSFDTCQVTVEAAISPRQRRASERLDYSTAGRACFGRKPPPPPQRRDGDPFDGTLMIFDVGPLVVDGVGCR